MSRKSRFVRQLTELAKSLGYTVIPIRSGHMERRDAISGAVLNVATTAAGRDRLKRAALADGGAS